MPAYKDEVTKKWYVQFWFTDFNNVKKKKKKRGFETKKEALEWEREFQFQENGKIGDLTFQMIYNIYIENMASRLKVSTLTNKKKTFKTHILPYFKNNNIEEINAMHIRKWQNTILEHKFTKSYFQTLQKELNAIFNFAYKYYDLKENPVGKAGIINDSPLFTSSKENNIWNEKEFSIFINEIQHKEAKVIFYILFYTGMRIGEVLALNRNDIDYENLTINVTKSYSKINRIEYITAPKTKGSIRKIIVPKKIAYFIKEYNDSHYLNDTDKMFYISRNRLHVIKNKITREKNLKHLRIHDFRHSHASILISNGINIVQVSKRLGHESIKMTLDTYTHLIEENNEKLVDLLDDLIE